MPGYCTASTEFLDGTRYAPMTGQTTTAVQSSQCYTRFLLLIPLLLAFSRHWRVIVGVLFLRPLGANPESPRRSLVWEPDDCHDRPWHAVLRLPVMSSCCMPPRWPIYKSSTIMCSTSNLMEANTCVVIKALHCLMIRLSRHSLDPLGEQI